MMQKSLQAVVCMAECLSHPILLVLVQLPEQFLCVLHC